MNLEEPGAGVTRTIESSPDFTTVRKTWRHGWAPFFQGIFGSTSVLMAMERYPSVISTASLRKKVRIVLLPPTAPSQISCIKSQGIIQEAPYPSSPVPSSGAKEASEKLMDDNKHLCNIYDLPIPELLDAVEQYGKETTKRSNAIFWNPPYNMPWIAESANSHCETSYVSRIWVSTSILCQ